MPAEPDDLAEAVDVVVVGAGHNGLVAAAYLAAAGLEVLVLEANEVPGGNTRTKELTLPGFAHDVCASAHVLIQSNPLVRDDELGLLAHYGLRYIHTDPAVVLPQDDGDALVIHRDLEATADEVARWSAADADALRGMIHEWTAGLAAVHGRWSSGLELGESGAARRYQALRERSAWDVIHERFEHPTIRSFVTWLSMATIQDPRRPGTGVLPSSLTAGRLSFGWSTPVGGSAALPNALVDCLTHHGGTVVCSAAVAAIEVADGTTRGVRLADGRRVRARKAVLSSAHLAALASMLDGGDASDDLTAARDTWRPGLSVFAVHAALRGNLGFDSRSGPLAATAGGFGSTEGVAAQIDALHRGDPGAADPWLLVVNQTVVDPRRAPDGQATVKILTIAPFERADGRTWQETKDEHAAALVERVRQGTDGLGKDDILAIRAESPVDIAGQNPHNLGGSCHGGEFVTRSGDVVPGWPTYRTGVPGLFLTGATTHPGGSVSARPGRNAARAVLQDLGIDPATVMGQA